MPYNQASDETNTQKSARKVNAYVSFPLYTFHPFHASVLDT